MKFLFISALSMFLVGCASTPIPTKNEIVTRPEINKVETQELGNSLVTYINTSTKPSIRIGGGLLSKHLPPYPPQVLRPMATYGDKLTKYYIDNPPPNAFFIREVCHDRESNKITWASTVGHCDSLVMALNSFENIEVASANYIDTTYPNFKQELIYNGKNGNSVKFLYREISGGYMRTPFTQEVQYDLGVSSMIGFKGARLEIIDSTNQYIKYKLIRMFDLQ